MAFTQRKYHFLNQLENKRAAKQQEVTQRPKTGILHGTTSSLFKSTSTSILLNGNMLQILSTEYDKLIKLNE